jgi:hypothetical protein
VFLRWIVFLLGFLGASGHGCQELLLLLQLLQLASKLLQGGLPNACSANAVKLYSEREMKKTVLKNISALMLSLNTLS